MAHIADNKSDDVEPLPIYRRPKHDKESDDTVKGNKTKPVESTQKERECVAISILSTNQFDREIRQCLTTYCVCTHFVASFCVLAVC